MRIGQISFVSFLSQVLASVVGFVATIAITRIFGSEVFGTYALIVAVVIWLKILATMGVQSAVAKRVSEGEDVSEYVTAGGLILLGALTVLSAVLLAARGLVNTYVGADATLWIVGLSWAGASLAFARGVLQGQRLVHYASALKPIDRTVRSVVQIAAAVTGIGLAGFLFGYGAGAIVAAAVGFAVVSEVGLARPARRHFRAVVDFARYSWLTRLSSRTFTSMDTVVLGAFVGASLIGIYEASWNLASMLALFGAVVGETMFPEMSKVASEGDTEAVDHLLEQALAYAGLLLVPGLVGSAVVGDLVLLVYGQEFGAGYYVLVLLVLSRLLYSYADQILTALNGLDRPDLSFRVNGTFIAVNVGLNVVLVWQYGWIGAAVATLTSSFVTLVLSYWTIRTLMGGISVPVGEIARQVAGAALMGGVVYAVRPFLGTSLVDGVVLVSLGAVVYFAALSAISARFRTTVFENLPSR